MEMFIDILLDSVVDTLKLVPFLFVTYWIMEEIEQRAGSKSQEAIERAGYAGPAIGAFLGAFPQCGFSAAASTLYAGRVITLGTLFAVYLSTSDEMLPILIAEQVDVSIMLKIIGIKVIIGMLTGFIVDAAIHVKRRKNNEDKVRIHDLCERDNCRCDEEHSPVRSALRHTLQVSLFIFLITFLIAALIALVGEDTFGEFISSNPTLSVFASALVGLIPNCGASVIITELYLDGTLGFGATMGGLLVSAGIGLLVLFRTNQSVKRNLFIMGVLFATGVLWGLAFQVLGITI